MSSPAGGQSNVASSSSGQPGAVAGTTLSAGGTSLGADSSTFAGTPVSSAAAGAPGTTSDFSQVGGPNVASTTHTAVSSSGRPSTSAPGTGSQMSTASTPTSGGSLKANPQSSHSPWSSALAAALEESAPKAQQSGTNAVQGQQGSGPLSATAAVSNLKAENPGMFIFFIGAKWNGDKEAGEDDNAVVFANFNNALERFRNGSRRTPTTDSQVTSVPTGGDDRK
jgi:hypothetical protein